MQMRRQWMKWEWTRIFRGCWQSMWAPGGSTSPCFCDLTSDIGSNANHSSCSSWILIICCSGSREFLQPRHCFKSSARALTVQPVGKSSPLSSWRLPARAGLPFRRPRVMWRADVGASSFWRHPSSPAGCNRLVTREDYKGAASIVRWVKRLYPFDDCRTLVDTYTALALAKNGSRDRAAEILNRYRHVNTPGGQGCGRTALQDGGAMAGIHRVGG